MTHFVPPSQTVCVKPLPYGLVSRIVDSISQKTNPTGVAYSNDKDPSCAGQYLIYANYKCARDAQRSCDTIEALLADTWSGTSSRPRVFVKADMRKPYFAVYVSNTPPGTSPADLEEVFSGYGLLHATSKICAIQDADNAFFVNFATFEGASSALQAARSRNLRFQGSVLFANAARNTMFINNLITAMRADRRYSFSLDDAKRVGAQMADWPPQPSSIEALLKAVPQHFALDRSAKQFHLIDQHAPLAPAQSTASSLTPPRTPSPVMVNDMLHGGDRGMMQRKDAMSNLLHSNFDLLHQLFLTVWYEAKGEAWVDSEGWASSSAAELKEELYYDELPPMMLKPVQDWDLSTLTAVFMARSLKTKLNEMSGRRGTGESGVKGDFAVTVCRCKALVEDKLISEEDLHSKFALTFAGVGSSGVDALQSIRFIRNILSHQGGSVKGITAASFDCLWRLTSDALATLAAALGPEHEVRLQQRTADLLQLVSAAGVCPPSPSLSTSSTSASSMSDSMSSGSGSHASHATVDNSDRDSVCSSGSTRRGDVCVHAWDVDQVLAMFERHKFPAEGVRQGQVDGATLVSLWREADAEALFTAAPPDGLGFGKLLFRGRFTSEMRKLLADDSNYD
jgi:hypothetical protein